MTRYVAAHHRTPIGDVLLGFADDGLICLEVTHDGAGRERFARRVDARVDDDSDAADEVRRQLDEYFDGRRRDFDLALDWRLSRGFARAALRAVCEIPYGETAGYGEVAIMAGSPGAARAVGTACATGPFSIVVPVHRVVRADGSLGEYGGRTDIKLFLLDLESSHG